MVLPLANGDKGTRSAHIVTLSPCHLVTLSGVRAAVGSGGIGGGVGTAGFLELWYICVSRSSATLAVSIEMRIKRLRKKAWQKMAGTDRATPSSVTTRACEMPSASLAGLGVPPWPSSMKLRIMP